jgi:hypothetical protein
MFPAEISKETWPDRDIECHGVGVGTPVSHSGVPISNSGPKTSLNNVKIENTVTFPPYHM